MDASKRVSKAVPCVTGPGKLVKGALRALALFSNTSRDADYVLAAVIDDSLPDGGTNLYLIQEQYKLQFMFELSDALYQALGNSVANAETDFSYERVDYRGRSEPVVTRVKVAGSPLIPRAAGLLLSLEATLFCNRGSCEVHVEAQVNVESGPITFYTDDWRQGAILARAYYYARVSDNIANYEIDEDNFLQRVQIV